MTEHRDVQRLSGSLFVFEGPDGVGKSSLVAEVRRTLPALLDCPVASFAFPGREPGTLGKHLYALHHDPRVFGIKTIAPTSLQMLHIAAHVDAIDSFIRPRVARGEIVLLDRYWWSTWVYGLTEGANPGTLRAMVELERRHWGELRPSAIFLLRRASTLRSDEGRAAYDRRQAEYGALAASEGAHSNVIVVENEGSIIEAATTVVEVVRRLTPMPQSA